ncbi:hypothetical protein AZI87_05745 [Bdellovibrio bacteriovorus]|uniref:DUF4440 domain-containing protein n=1 Tax=Bdellovibrio bacteriovorus TaxID=959 RepID=A0A161PQ79_BDEBC|nr:nuclear transport factor 2 family protein [Bdellovibrio bacteriovorus]KYG68733.1 hypothetical protein AZI87_05745 [Bdellovibrio bacteriovorus]
MNAPNKEEILNLENQYWDAMKTKDVEAAVSLTKFPCIVTGPEGVRSIDEEQYRQMMNAMTSTDRFKDIEINEPQLTILNEDAALLTYNIEVSGMKMLDVSTWVRENGKWVCAYHSENPVH